MVKKQKYSHLLVSPGTAASSVWPCIAGVCGLLLAWGIQLRRKRPEEMSALESECWSRFKYGRQGIEDSPIQRNETLLAWARKHGAIFPTSDVELILGNVRGLRLGKLQTNRSSGVDAVVHIPASLGLFLRSQSDKAGAWNIDCLQLADSHEVWIIGLVLLLLKEKRREAISPWAPWLRILPTFGDFVLHPLLSPVEELRRFAGLDLADYMLIYQRDVRRSYDAILSRPVGCLPEAVSFQSYEEYLWARLIAETRAIRTSVCGKDVSSFIPIFDYINTGKASSCNVRLVAVPTSPYFSILMQGEMSPGDQLRIHYKDAANDELAGTWGFTLEDNPIRMDRLDVNVCSHLREAACIIPGCLFAVLRNEACD